MVDDEPDPGQLAFRRMRCEIQRGLYSFVFARKGVEALDRLNDNGGEERPLPDAPYRPDSASRGRGVQRRLFYGKGTLGSRP